MGPLMTILTFLLVCIWILLPVLTWWYLSGIKERMQDVKELLQKLVTLEEARALRERAAVARAKIG